MQPDQTHAKARIEVIDTYGEWFVRVIEDGMIPLTKSFETEYYAVAFAEGHRIRLGLERYERL
jgi:hypothetical protein